METYSAPVLALAQIGSPNDIGVWRDYLRAGIKAEHIPELIHLLKDGAFLTADEPEVYAHIHAWRALGQLRATAATKPLLDLIEEQEVDDDWSDWISEEVPRVIGMIGPSAIPAIATRLEQRGKKQWIPTYFTTALVEIAKQYPDTRTDVIRQLSRVLETATENDSTLNGFVISDLVDLKAQEAWPEIEKAFATGNVDESIGGNADAVKWDLGLSTTRPQSRRHGPYPLTAPRTNAKQRFNERQRKKKFDKKNKKKRK